jgi:hypothetical protein
MIMPGRIWVAGIDIAKEISLYDCGLQEPAARLSGRRAGHNSAVTGAKALFYTELRGKGNRRCPAAIFSHKHKFKTTVFPGLCRQPGAGLELGE